MTFATVLINRLVAPAAASILTVGGLVIITPAAHATESLAPVSIYSTAASYSLAPAPTSVGIQLLPANVNLPDEFVASENPCILSLPAPWGHPQCVGPERKTVANAAKKCAGGGLNGAIGESGSQIRGKAKGHIIKKLLKQASPLPDILAGPDDPAMFIPRPAKIVGHALAGCLTGGWSNGDE